MTTTARRESDSDLLYQFDSNGGLQICCSSCRVYQDADDVHFPADLHCRYGRSTTCRVCARRRTAAWRRTHRAQAAAQSARRYARVVAAGKELTKEERQQVLDDAGHRCAACGSTERLELDHIVPLNQDGSHRPYNRQVLCHQHNLSKGNRVVDYRDSIRLRRAA